LIRRSEIGDCEGRNKKRAGDNKMIVAVFHQMPPSVFQAGNPKGCEKVAGGRRDHRY
jgi:hypothetical protein